MTTTNSTDPGSGSGSDDITPKPVTEPQAEAMQDSADMLRARMVAALVERGQIVSPRVRAAFEKVPRERFAPEAPLAAVYAAHEVVITKRGPDGRATSSISAPWLQAQMIEAARLAPGASVLEIGSGGYNAALLAEVVGSEGLVVSVDIDPFVTGRAIRFLAETGYERVQVVLADAERIPAEYVPDGGFDALVVTVGCWDVPWGHLLAPGGRMVVPLRFSAVTRCFTFVRDGERWAGLDPTVCGFVSIQGEGAFADQTVTLAGGVSMTMEGGPDLDAAALDEALTGDGVTVWTGVTVGSGEPHDTLHLRLAAVDDRFGMIWATPDPGTGERTDLVHLATRWHCPVLITPACFAYLTVREHKNGWEFGARGHGPRGSELAHQLRDHVVDWDRCWRRRGLPDFVLHPVDALVPAAAEGRVWRKRHTQLEMSWQPADLTSS
ncbi:methyltransferase, FxLD system [Nonomuraea sp. NPDC050310]|uniref:methyltransferase, FxLD system n=1 Tax=Nonomuraea sp. NPDC050310 TaxID=3154935 RepID=UPI00340C6B28